EVVEPATATCRTKAGVCEVAETCSGTAGVPCAADSFVSSSMVCRTGSGDPNGSGVVCDPDEYCTGSSAACPTDVIKTSGTTCRTTAGVCDVAETCSGTAGGAGAAHTVGSSRSGLRHG